MTKKRTKLRRQPNSNTPKDLITGSECHQDEDDGGKGFLHFLRVTFFLEAAPKTKSWRQAAIVVHGVVLLATTLLYALHLGPEAWRAKRMHRTLEKKVSQIAAYGFESLRPALDQMEENLDHIAHTLASIRCLGDVVIWSWPCLLASWLAARDGGGNGPTFRCI